MNLECNVELQRRVFTHPLLHWIARLRARNVPEVKGFGSFHSSAGETNCEKSPKGTTMIPPEINTHDADEPFFSVWGIESVELTPEVQLNDWHCFELQLPGNLSRTRHLAGTNVQGRHGQVSSAISELTSGSRTCKTASGRVYTLGMRTGFGLAGVFTWQRWVRINNARDIVDVTAEVNELFAQVT